MFCGDGTPYFYEVKLPKVVKFIIICLLCLIIIAGVVFIIDYVT